MLTSRCLHISANQTNPYQNSTESWDSLCKTHTCFTTNSYTFHTSPISNTLLEHNEKSIENKSKNTSKIPPKSTKNGSRIPPWDSSWEPLGKRGLYFTFCLPGKAPTGAQKVHQKDNISQNIKTDCQKNTLEINAWKHIRNIWFLEAPEPFRSSSRCSESTVLACAPGPLKVFKNDPKTIALGRLWPPKARKRPSGRRQKSV